MFILQNYVNIFLDKGRRGEVGVMERGQWVDFLRVI